MRLDPYPNVGAVAKRVTFRGTPGQRCSTYVGADAASVEWVFPESGELSFDEDDQEPVNCFRTVFAPYVTESKPEAKPEPADKPKKEQ